MADQPLDEIFPGWREKRAEAKPIHSRVLEQPLGDGAVSFVIVVWRDPGGGAALHTAMRRVIESALLSELSRPASDLIEEENRVPQSLRVLLYERLQGTDDALRAFGLKRHSGEGLEECFAHVRGEASALGFEVDVPAEVFEAPFALTDGAMDFEAALRSRAGERVFGSEPGSFFAALNDIIVGLDKPGLAPRADSLDVMERMFVADVEGLIRWVPPLAFQTLCDAVGVCASKDIGRTVQWAPSDKEDDGFVPPPMLRLKDAASWAHVPLGRDLMRWCVMPRQIGEQVPPLSAWLNDRFGMG